MREAKMIVVNDEKTTTAIAQKYQDNGWNVQVMLFNEFTVDLTDVGENTHHFHQTTAVICVDRKFKQ